MLSAVTGKLASFWNRLVVQTRRGAYPELAFVAVIVSCVCGFGLLLTVIVKSFLMVGDMTASRPFTLSDAFNVLCILAMTFTLGALSQEVRMIWRKQREANIAASIDATAYEIVRMNLKPGDSVCINVPGGLSAKERDSLVERLEKTIPDIPDGVRIVVSDMNLQVERA